MDIVASQMSTQYYEHEEPTHYEELNDLQLKKGLEFMIVNIADALFGIFQLIALFYYFKSWIHLGRLKMMDAFTNLTFTFLTIAVIVRFFG